MIAKRRDYSRIRDEMLSLLDQNRPAEAEECCRLRLVPAYDAYNKAGEALFAFNVKAGQNQGNGIFAMSAATHVLVAALGLMLFAAGFAVGFFK